MQNKPVTDINIGGAVVFDGDGVRYDVVACGKINSVRHGCFGYRKISIDRRGSKNLGSHVILYVVRA